MTNAAIAVGVGLIGAGGFIALALWLLSWGHSSRGDYPPDDDDGTAWGI